MKMNKKFKIVALAFILMGCKSEFAPEYRSVGEIWEAREQAIKKVESAEQSLKRANEGILPPIFDCGIMTIKIEWSGRNSEVRIGLTSKMFFEEKAPTYEVFNHNDISEDGRAHYKIGSHDVATKDSYFPIMRDVKLNGVQCTLNTTAEENELIEAKNLVTKLSEQYIVASRNGLVKIN